MEVKEKLAFNALAGAGMLFVSVAVAFVLTPVIVGALGDRDYGIWEVILVLVGYVGLIDLGLGPALVRFFAFESARDDPRAVQRVFTTAVAALAAAGLFAFSVLGAFSLFPAGFVGVAHGEVPALGSVFVIVGLHLMLKLPGTVLTAHLLAMQRHWILYLVRAVVTIAQAILIAIALMNWDGSGLVWLAAITLGADLCEHAVYLVVIARLEPELRLRREHLSWSTLVELYRFGAKSMLGLVSERLRVQAMPLVIAQVIGVERVVFFALAQRLSSYATQLGMALARPLAAHWSDLAGREHTARIQSDWLVTSRLLQFLYSGMAIGIAFLGGAFITQWMGPEYGARCAPLVALISLVLFFEGLAPNALSVMVGMNRHGRAGVVLLGSAVLAIVLAAALGREFGLMGVAAGYVFASACSTLGVMVLGCQAVGVSPLGHVRRTLLPLLAPLSAEGACLVWLQWAFGEADSFAEIAVRALAAGGLYTGFWWLATLTAEERGLLLELPLRRLRRATARGTDRPV